LRVCHATRHDHAPKAWGPRNVLWSPSARREYVARSVKCVGATWGISGDLCHVYYAFLQVRYNVSVSHIVRANHGDECELPPTMRMSPICGKGFSFGEEWI
jgi:hypothetical protein